MLSPGLKDLLERATARYEAALPGSQAASFLEARGITAPVARSYRLGAVSDPLPEHENYEGMLALPYITRSGVVAIKFRQVEGDARPKYLAPAGQGARLYNVNSFFTAGASISICEGELDALVLDGLCGIPAVGVPGVRSWDKNVHRRVFEGYQRIWVWADRDARKFKDECKSDGCKDGCRGHRAGDELSRAICEDLPQAAVVHLPGEQSDVNDCYLEKGADYLRSLVGLNPTS